MINLTKLDELIEEIEKDVKDCQKEFDDKPTFPLMVRQSINVALRKKMKDLKQQLLEDNKMIKWEWGKKWDKSLCRYIYTYQSGNLKYEVHRSVYDWRKWDAWDGTKFVVELATSLKDTKQLCEQHDKEVK